MRSAPGPGHPGAENGFQFCLQLRAILTASHTAEDAQVRRDAECEEVIITRAGHEPVVIVALDDYESLKETAYLLRSPANARRLLSSIDRLENGAGTEHELAE